MTSYIATRTNNLLIVEENYYFFNGVYYPGLIDEKTGHHYDHPEDSYAGACGLPTALSMGKIVPVEGNKTSWKSLFANFKIPEILNLTPAPRPIYA